MGVEKHHWLELLIPFFRRTAPEMGSLRTEQEDLIAHTQNLEAQTATLRQQVESLENANRKGEEERERKEKSKDELVQQVQRRDQIIEELQSRLSKQQATSEKLTKRLEAIQLERDEVYQQYNTLLEHMSDSEQLGGGSRQTGNSKQQSLPDPETGEWRLNIGCGKVKKSGYLNADIDITIKPDLVVSLDAALPFSSRSFALVEVYHVIEHVYPWVSVEILKEFWRILKPEGKLVIECPNLEFACAWLVQNSDYRSDSQMGMWAIYGDPNSQNALQMHKWGYTPITLAEILKKAGFVRIRREVPQTHVPARDFRIIAIKPSQIS